ncbi:hypothetical protein HMI54_005088, partial [Coelomomyces lativittatus]
SSETVKAVLLKYLHQIEHSKDEFDLVYDSVRNGSTQKQKLEHLDHELVNPLEHLHFDEKKK